jgi:hypothetical protein
MPNGSNVSAGPPSPKRTRRKIFINEISILRRDGLRKYIRVHRSLRRFNRSVQEMARAEGYDY